MKRLTAIVTTTFEECLFSKLYNEWGGMQVEREARLMLTRLSATLANISLRSQFGRLDQIVLLMNFMKPSDVLEYRTLEEHLSMSEIESCLSRRTGFTRDEIAQAIHALKKQSS